MKLMQLPAPAKLNLFLHVVGRRDDGYHQLQSLFVPIDYYDYIDVQLLDNGQIERDTNALHIPYEQDLIVKAARLLQQYSGTRLGARLTLHKNIPEGAGLGGGSSDAATTLQALNRLWGLALSDAELMQLALQLGADVPFFVYGRAAIVQGVGERVDKAPIPLWASFVLLHPNLHIATAEIFRHPMLHRKTPVLSYEQWYEKIQTATKHHELPVVGHNDLQAVACKLYPQLQEMVDWCAQVGVSIQMTGSGSTFFAAFTTVEQALDCQQKLAQAWQDEPPACAKNGHVNKLNLTFHQSSIIQ